MTKQVSDHDQRADSLDPKIAADYHDLYQYFSGAIDIRNSLQFNKEDSAHTNREHGVIRYVFDSNVLLFFLNPANERQAVDPFATKDRRTATTLAVVTAEYLLSRELVGQWGAPPLISQWHWKEVAKVLRRVRAKIDPEVLRAKALEPARFGASGLGGEVAEVVRAAQTERNMRRSLATLSSMEPRIRALITDEAYILTLFEKLRDRTPVDPLTLDENAHGAVLNLNKADVERWRELIAYERADDVVEGDDADEHSKNDDRDARTIEQVIQLNLNARKSFGPPTRYVFVTHDRAVYNAGVRWWQTQSQLDFFPFRRMSQYIPVLNTDAMPNAVSESGLSAQLTQVLDLLLQIDRSRRKRLPLYVPRSSVKAGPTAPKNSLAAELSPAIRWIASQSSLHASRRQAQDLWAELSASSILLNSSLLRRRIRAFDLLADFIERAEDVRSGVVDFMHERIDAFEIAHLELSLLHQLAAQIVKGKTLAGQGRTIRGIVALREDFSSVVGGKGLLHGYLDDVVRKADTERIRGIASRLTQCAPAHQQFFLASIAFWSGHWEQAAHQADRALAILLQERSEDRAEVGGGALVAEVRYFVSVASRYAALDLEGDFVAMERDLRRLLTMAPRAIEAAAETRDAFLELRARIEQALIEASLAFVITLSQPARIDEALPYVNASYATLDAVASKLEKAADGERPEVRASVMTDMLTCVVGCLVLRAMRDPADGRAATTRWRGMDRKLKHLFDAHPERVPQFYEISTDMLALLSSNDPVERDRLGREVVDRVDKALRGGDHMTWFDRYAMAAIRDQVETLVAA